MSGLPLLALLLLAATSVQADGKYRLSKDVKPTKYEITLVPDLDKFVFTGTVVITLDLLNEVDTITLNQKNLTLTKADVSLSTGTVRSLEIDNNFELLIIRFNEILKKGSYTLTIKYNGVLNDKKRGFYRSRYLDKDNKIKYIATTHFEPTGARLAFPCWDEPDYKAVFKIILKHASLYKAVISNMDLEKPPEVDPKTKMTTTTFKDSKAMSSYLVAFVVSDYEYKESNDTKFRVYTKPHALEQTKYALEFGQKVISKLDEYTGIKYLDKMPKMDQISIKDFSAGAMENWGLVTYRETALLYEENVSTTRSKQSIATIIAHEFAHQWFGNLVSPKWWEYIWLNEGFANYFQYFITNQLEEKWRLMEVYAVEALQGTAFAADARENTRPMNKAVVRPDEISNLFDSIAYQKAGSVIRMMSSILTEKVFQRRIRAYLNNYSFNVAESKNLIDHLQDGGTDTWAGQKFETIMDEWINKPGYPVVTVSKADKKVVLTQERFMLYGPSDNTKWWIPITYVQQSNHTFNDTKPKSWLGKTGNLTIPDIADDEWIIVNTQQTGYYRVNYDVKNWEQLQKYLLTKDYDKIHPVNRAQLIDDALAMARTNRLDYMVALSLSLYLHQETDYIPWITANRHLNFFQNMLYTSKHYIMYKSYVRYILEAVVKNVTYAPSDKDEHTTKIHRANVMKWACKAEEKECLKYAEKEFEAWLKEPGEHKLDADLKSNILCYGLRFANEDKWQKAYKELSNTTADEDELNTLLAVMGCSNSLPILKKLLEQSLQKNSSIGFDVAVQSVLTNNPLKGFDLVLNMISDNYQNILKLNNSEDKIKSCIDSLASIVVTPDQFLRLSMLNTKVGAKADIVASTVEKSTRNINWVDLHGEEVGNWLHKNEQLFHSAGSTIVLASFLLVFSFLFTRFY